MSSHRHTASRIVARSIAVVWSVCVTSAASAQAEQQPLIKRLDDQTRGRVVLAMAALVMLGVFLVGLVWYGFRILRRRQREFQAEVQQRNLRPHDPDDWARQPVEKRP